MANDFEFAETSEEIINDKTNITEQNPLKEGLKILANLFFIIFCLYFTVYFGVGILIISLSNENQIKLENAISKLNTTELAFKCYKSARTDKIKNLILTYDKKYPKTSKLEIKIIESKDLNAFCFPDGKIYITSGLYNFLKNDDELAFVVAHEMAHYKNKDHLENLKSAIANSSIALLLSLVTTDENIGDIVANTIELGNLKHSRNAEKKADKYAAEALLNIYGTTSGGVRVLKILSQKSDLPEAASILSTHPATKSRIKYLKNPRF